MRILRIQTVLLSLASATPALAGTHHADWHHKRHVDYRAGTTQEGIASWYGYGPYHPGRRTASGERFDPQAMTCAHRTLPMGSLVRVTEIATGNAVVVKVNDRGPFGKGRIVDLSEGAARELGIHQKGVTLVRVEVVRPLASAESLPKSRT